MTVKKYRKDNNHFITFNQISFVPGGFETDDEDNQYPNNLSLGRYTPTYKRNDTTIKDFDSKSIEKLSPNFDNHVLGSDPFRRRKHEIVEIHRKSLSPERNIISQNFVSYPNSMNNLSKFKQNSDVLKQTPGSGLGIYNIPRLNIRNESLEGDIQKRSRNNIESFKTISRPSLSSTEIDFSRDISALNQLKQMEESLYKKLGFK